MGTIIFIYNNLINYYFLILGKLFLSNLQQLINKQKQVLPQKFMELTWPNFFLETFFQSQWKFLCKN